MTDYSAGLAPAGPGRIDAHVHLWQLSVRDQPWTAGLPPLRRDYRLDELRHWLAAADVQTAVLVQTVQVAAETPEMLAIADAADEIAGVVGWVDLCAADVAGRAARRRPGLRFLLDPGGKPPIASSAMDPWHQHVNELAGCPNVGVKLSGLLTEAGPGVDARTLRPYSDHLLGAFGPGRTMFGSGWPVSTPRAGHSRVVVLTAERLGGLSSDRQAKVSGTTAAAWYGFGATDHDRAGRPCG